MTNQRLRQRGTRRSVLIADKMADWTITVGGLLVIFAVLGIMFFLAEVVGPLFGGGKVEGHRSYQLTAMDDAVFVNTDEYRTMSVRVSADGRVESFHLATGTPLVATQLDFDGHKATAVGATVQRNDVAFGFDDGTVRFGQVALRAEVLTEQMLPQGLRPLSETDLTDGEAVYTSIPGNQFRKVYLDLVLDEPQVVSESGAAIVAIDYRMGGSVERPTRSFVTVDADGIARLSRAETRINLMTRAATTNIRTSTLPALPEGIQASAVAMTTQADQVYVAERNGTVYRFDTRNVAEPTLAETVRLTPQGVDLTVMAFLNGEQALFIGGADGSANIWFRLQIEGAATLDGYKMVLTRELTPHEAPVTGFDSSMRRKSLVTSDAAGNVWFRHATSEQVLLQVKRDGASAEDLLMLSPRDDAMILLGRDGADIWNIRVPHPETTWRTIFGKVWYEGYPEPGYTWQSSSGNDTFEPKFSLIPLIFGTMKATFYSLLFAVPIALMGAIYTSEFLHPRLRGAVKPVMEMMESLPTVVLGFIAALILAPLVETWIGAIMLVFVALPLSLIAAAYLWQILPQSTVLRLQGVPKFLFMGAVVLFSCWLAYMAGPAFESAFFAGDLKAWTTGNIGSGTPFMFLLLLPLSFAALTFVFNRSIGHAFRQRLREMDKSKAGVVDALRWLAMLAAAGLVSYAFASLLAMVGYDPRGGVVDSYVQRNALVVGFVMGFAVIPNIYTLAEDALNAVPSSLRAASLASGATPWQTAVWVILPTAMSGVFAAVMIGMGRAVGETMIVVMAAGNTPVLDWNIFNGLRTLSANIAVELPESVKDGTLYRMLFLAALSLFIMTFCINTVAEVIRQRFRKRAFQL
ncbi:ABC transporter permease subunit [Telmatospirillum sp. J64-1]|uniref:ABC transporter permease subunit n=1 Tax=Telmatospirillum sp. J64-1 TaxID=2502183 RepID=UPI00163D9AB1|nr:ABC transporter permease subunit [Telmatospirillum sp. J64-1]